MVSRSYIELSNHAHDWLKRAEALEQKAPVHVVATSGGAMTVSFDPDTLDTPIILFGCGEALTFSSRELAALKALELNGRHGGNREAGRFEATTLQALTRQHAKRYADAAAMVSRMESEKACRAAGVAA